MVAIAGLLVAMTPSAGLAQIKLPAGTEVTVSFKVDVSSKYVAPGEEVMIQLAEDIAVGGVVLVKAGCDGKAMVKSVESAGKGGKAGKLEIELVGLDPEGGYQALEDKKIALAAVESPLLAEGKGKKTLSYLLIFGLFIKGGEGVMVADQPIKATVTEDIFIIPGS
jgi:hypothetical protein